MFIYKNICIGPFWNDLINGEYEDLLRPKKSTGVLPPSEKEDKFYSGPARGKSKGTVRYRNIMLMY
jgi:hypothetical protein